MFISFLKTKLPSAGKYTALTFLRFKKKKCTILEFSLERIMFLNENRETGTTGGGIIRYDKVGTGCALDFNRGQTTEF